MIKLVSRITMAACAILFLDLAGCASDPAHGKSADSAITGNPRSRHAGTNDSVDFQVDVDSKRAPNPQFQWFFNGAPIDRESAAELGVTGANERSMRIRYPKQKNVGLYQCAIQYGSSNLIEMSESAALTLEHHSVLTVYGTPIGGSGDGSGCPPRYAGYVNYSLPTSPYGWRFPNGGVAKDPTRNDTVVAYFGSPLSNYKCGTTNFVNLPRNTTCPYRFTIYF
jgi:hypothetical protein